MTVARHMSWCVGRHNEPGGECRLERKLGDDTTALIDGIHCDGANVWVEAFMNTPAEVDSVIALLGEFRDVLVASGRDIDCSQHHHGDEEED